MIKESRRTGHTVREMIASYELAYGYYEEHRFDASLDELSNLRKRIRPAACPLLFAYVVSLMARVYESLGDSESARRYAREACELSSTGGPSYLIKAPFDDARRILSALGEDFPPPQPVRPDISLESMLGNCPSDDFVVEKFFKKLEFFLD